MCLIINMNWNECTFINDNPLRDQEAFPGRSLVAHIVAQNAETRVFLPVFLRIQHPCSCQTIQQTPVFWVITQEEPGILGYNSEIWLEAKPGMVEVSLF